jgi:hypothetical protein
MGLREQAYDVNASIFGNPEDRAVLGLATLYSGVLAFVNPNEDEHYIYPTANGLSAGNNAQMLTGTEGVNLVAPPVNAGQFLNWRGPGVSVFGNPRVSQLMCVGGDGIRGAIGFLTGAAEAPVFLYFTDGHIPQLGSAANWRAGAGGTALSTALAGPFTKHDKFRDGMTDLTGPVVIAGRQDKPSGLGLIVGDGQVATMVWTVNGTALAAGSPLQFYAL